LFRWSRRARGIDALKLAIDRHAGNRDVELVHYAQPLLREANLLAQEMDKACLRNSACGSACRCWKGISTAALCRHAADKLDVTVARLSDELDDPALHIADARYQAIAAICDVSVTP
jgi:ferrous iron transport protein B